MSRFRPVAPCAILVPFLLVAALAVLPSEARAQHGARHVRSQVFLGFNGGVGFGDLRIGGDDGAREAGFAGNIRFAWMTGERWALGFEVSGWTHAETDVTTTVTLLGGAATWFPAGGLFLRGGLGGATMSYELELEDVGQRDTVLDLDERGWGALAAAGYEIRLTRSFAAGPQVEAAWIWLGDFESIDAHGLDGADTSVNYLSASLGLTWYF